jgi:hypothetical protein
MERVSVVFVWLMPSVVAASTENKGRSFGNRRALFATGNEITGG